MVDNDIIANLRCNCMHQGLNNYNKQDSRKTSIKNKTIRWDNEKYIKATQQQIMPVHEN